MSTSGIFLNPIDKTFYKFIQYPNSIEMIKVKSSLEKILQDSTNPIWMLRHSLGISGGEENYSHFHKSKDLNLEREHELNLCMLDKKHIRNLFYKGLKVSTEENEYSHAVGPIHAGIIEPGHFRFIVRGEEIQNLLIRLGFQHRGIQNILVKKNPIQAIPISETISGDSTIAYAIAFSRIYETALQETIPLEVTLQRAVLLELERVAMHIGDLGAMSGDIGYYPLHGVCATDRGAPLGMMEVLTGSRFGKGSVFPSQLLLNSKLSSRTILQSLENLKKAYSRVEKEFKRATKHATIRERLQDCGIITKSQVQNYSFLGMVSRSSGVEQDLRLGEEFYSNYKHKLELKIDYPKYTGDVWSRFYLRFNEIKNSIEWLLKVLPEFPITEFDKTKFLKLQNLKINSGLYYSAVEGFRGNVLVALYLNQKAQIEASYIRDPSVLNWHALELAARGALIGDFPINNKSFNLSYVGFDL
ncbi:MAG: metal (Ni/Fe) hydrogenase large subunit [Leptospiraceae bacterium]|nr:metal (Ni/Fe) hydrogenase large subunit [Leptospiraceae bacterium]